MPATIDQLVDALKTRTAILFAGAGISRSLGLPSWDELTAEMAKELGFDAPVFAGYGGDPELAEYYHLIKGSLGPLRSEFDRRWHENEERIDSSRIYQAILDLNFPTIYTTNFDRWLEIAFNRRNKAYTKVASVRDFVEIREATTQIVKFHGDFDDDYSLVLTESNYFERLGFESPLDIKLRSDCLGRAILFIGYSLRDINIRFLLYKLHLLWRGSAYSDARPKSFVFLSRPNPIQERILESRGILPIVSRNDEETSGLVDFLEGLIRDSAKSRT